MTEARLRIFEGLINSDRGYEDRLPFISDLIPVCLVVKVVFFSCCLCAGENLKNCYEHPLDSMDWSFNSTLQKFDSSRGDLTGAQIRIILTYKHNLSVSNRGGYSCQYQLERW